MTRYTLRPGDAPHAERPPAPGLDVRHVGGAAHGGVLVVLDEPQGGPSMAALVRSLPAGAQCWNVSSPWAALQLIRRRPTTFGLLILHDEIGPTDPVHFLRRVRALAPGLPAIVLSGSGAGAVLVTPEKGAWAAHFLPDEIVAKVWRSLRGPRRARRVP